ncbi:MAG: glycogen/starch/alpha-glucan phosphorylase [Bacillus sp. (in: Bacteria)]|uniref:Alpha-1,4 glucan phosphorylase n=1 Tax=Niallia alba TaxID=2729105 RepID=A0A7Y0KAX9_9BACI|nr:glycogen/starch/alpha-glucan phosphorylase [Niallia alba]MBQ6446687.1 glycogen/starch/alpha-glucan phosphorylase [Bacillus sp. (in: firmicutes)]NMO78896.1 glycogen/starch/alpha-glucan phosphorylase [Niallia alba]
MFSNKERFKRYFLQRLEMTYGKTFEDTTSSDHFQTLGHMIREYVSSNWIQTNEQSRNNNGKQVYYLSIEFLLGRLLHNNLINLGIDQVVIEGLADLGIDFFEVEDIEHDAGLGNGGLGRLAACFLDSLATLNLPGHGYGIRYKHGLFEQRIVDGYQIELPEQWLKQGQVWEVRKEDLAVDIYFWGNIDMYERNGKLQFRHLNAEAVTAVPHDVPVIGYHTSTVNTLRLWNAEPTSLIAKDVKDIMRYKRETESISGFLYPDDSNDEGKILRLKQQYFLVSASLQSIVRNYKQQHKNISEMHHYISIHVNDTHPVLAIPELMRILMDEEGLGWEEAWDITTNTISYTNHTTLSEALEQWPIYIFQPLLPRIYMIINEINERFCKELWERYPGDFQKIEKMAIIAHGMIKMAHLALVGSYSVNGVAEIHTEILKKREMADFYAFYPEKFNNKTNGITHRRWLIKTNPKLTNLISQTIGDKWIDEPIFLKELLNYQDDVNFKENIASIKHNNKEILAKIIKEKNGILVDPSSIFDVQVKRLHAYKRQLLNILHIMTLYNKLREDPTIDMEPRTFIFGAKASPGYYYAKKIIKLINTVAHKVNNDKRIQDKLKVVFLENYRVSLAEHIFPAADVSEQISTASKEASGTGNMKFMMNGALTIGTLDGANIEMHDLVGDENIFIFGMNADQVLELYQNGGYSSREYYYHDDRIHEVFNQLKNGFYDHPSNEFDPILDSLLIENDQFFVLKDFNSYANIHEKVNQVFKNKQDWLQKSIVNIAMSGHFSSDRTIKEYADDIWHIKPYS